MKIVVLGFDGVDPDFLSSIRSGEELSGLDGIEDAGIYSDLDSTVVPISAMAWSSFLTGVNPGKHGIYDFVTRNDPESTEFSITSSKDRQAPELWYYLNEIEKRVGVIGVPLTYPVDTFDGFVISGYPTPNREKSFHPASLADEIQTDPHELHGRVHYDGTNKDAFIKDQFRQWDATENFYRHALEEKDWDVLVNVFKQTDDIGHVAWDEEPLYEVYRRADEVVQYTRDYIESAEEDILLFVMSDHGFGPVDKTLFLNNILKELGYLQIKNNAGSRARNMLCKEGFNLLNAYRAASKLGLGERVMSVGYDEETALARLLYTTRDIMLLSARDIDTERSACFSRGNYGQLFVGDADIDALISDLLSYAVDGKSIISNVYRAEDHFHGDATDLAPDLMIETPNYRYLTARGFALATDKPLTDHIIGRTAEHKPTGIFFCEGDDIDSDGDIDNPTLTDFLPTILYALGEPVPDYLDGNVLPIFETKPTPEFENYDVHAGSNETTLSSKEESELQAQLESLGYSS